MLDRLKWSHLAIFGNTPLAKAVVFLPIVAQFVILSKTYHPESWGLYNTTWLYWSLMALALGQAIYFWKSPRSIRKYGDDFESFVEQALATWSNHDLYAVASAYTRSFFQHWGDGKLRLSEDGSPFTIEKFKSLRSSMNSRPEGNHASPAWSMLNYIASKEPIKPSHTNPKQQHLYDSVLSEAIGRPLDVEERTQLAKLRPFLSQKQTAPNGKKAF